MPYALPAPGSSKDREVVKMISWFTAMVEDIGRCAQDDGEADLADIARATLTKSVLFLEAWAHRDDNSPQQAPQARGETE